MSLFIGPPGNIVASSQPTRDMDSSKWEEIDTQVQTLRSGLTWKYCPAIWTKDIWADSEKKQKLKEFKEEVKDYLGKDDDFDCAR